MRWMRSARVVAVVGAALLTVQAALADVDPAKQPLDRPTKADTARAKSAVIRQSDVFAGFRVDQSRESRPRVPHCAAYPGDRSGITVTGSATSSFRRGDISLASTVMWFKTKADSDRYWRATVRFGYVKCLAELLPLEFSVKPRITGANQIPMVLGRADRVAAYRLVARIPSTPQYTWIETAAFVKKGRAVGLIRTVWLNHVCDCHNDLGLAVSRRMTEAG